MTWKIDGPQGNEAAKIRWNLVPYMNGRCLDLGCGPYKAFPHFVGVDNGHHDNAFGWQNKADVIVDSCEKLLLFADEAVDMVFSSHLLEHIPYENVPKALNDWMRVLRKGGHLCLYLPSDQAYPKVGERGANPDHKWDCNYEKVVSAMETVTYDWDLIEYEHRTEKDEYSIWMVFKKL